METLALTLAPMVTMQLMVHNAQHAGLAVLTARPLQSAQPALEPITYRNNSVCRAARQLSLWSKTIPAQPAANRSVQCVTTQTSATNATPHTYFTTRVVSVAAPLVTSQMDWHATVILPTIPTIPTIPQTPPIIPPLKLLTTPWSAAKCFQFRLQ